MTDRAGAIGESVRLAGRRARCRRLCRRRRLLVAKLHPVRPGTRRQQGAPDEKGAEALRWGST